MGRPKGGKNIIRTPKEKEKIVKDLLAGKLSWSQTWQKYNISESTLSKWKYDYIEKGIEGLKSKSGKHKNPNSGLHLRKPKNKKIARLKKGYMVKGVGAEKEFVTTFDKNIK